MSDSGLDVVIVTIWLSAPSWSLGKGKGYLSFYGQEDHGCLEAAKPITQSELFRHFPIKLESVLNRARFYRTLSFHHMDPTLLASVVH